MLRRFARGMEVVGWLLAAAGVVVSGALLGVVVTGSEDVPALAAVGALGAGIAYGFPLVLIGRFSALVVDYMVARTEQLIDVDDDDND